MFITKPTWDILIVLVIVLLFVGPKRLPQLSRSIGESIKEFKGGIGANKSEQLDDAKAESEETDSKRESVA
ncbi:MAG: twin-arginine translocase TatA/TatE family subunit [Solirubrobacterales bacterium]|nr:twin-arginine translocase TatA/TatE family subunit [Solirubrobacterales bacterium]